MIQLEEDRLREERERELDATEGDEVQKWETPLSAAAIE